jgi:type VI secretion system VasI family protein
MKRNDVLMKNTYCLIFALLMASPFSVVAEGFKVDMPLMDIINKYDVLNIGSLAVGEKGLVSIYGLKICVDKGDLKVASITELDSSPSKYSYTFEVTRSPNDNVTVVFSRKGKTPDAEAVKDAVLRVVSASDCEEIKKEYIPLLSVGDFLGANSLSELVSQSNSTAIQSESNKEHESSSSEAAEILNNWIVSESKSPIDDSPTVSMMKVAEAGDQILVLRCKENTTDAYIKTDDFLGEDSTNVTVRYDSQKAQKAQKQKFSLSTNNKALFFSPAISNIKKMMKSKNIVIRYHTYSGTPNTVSFKMSDLKNKIKPLRAACHW